MQRCSLCVCCSMESSPTTQSAPLSGLPESMTVGEWFSFPVSRCSPQACFGEPAETTQSTAEDKWHTNRWVTTSSWGFIRTLNLIWEVCGCNDLFGSPDVSLSGDFTAAGVCSELNQACWLVFSNLAVSLSSESDLIALSEVLCHVIHQVALLLLTSRASVHPSTPLRAFRLWQSEVVWTHISYTISDEDKNSENPLWAFCVCLCLLLCSLPRSWEELRPADAQTDAVFCVCEGRKAVWLICRLQALRETGSRGELVHEHRE